MKSKGGNAFNAQREVNFRRQPIVVPESPRTDVFSDQTSLVSVDTKAAATTIDTIVVSGVVVTVGIFAIFHTAIEI
ncbi:MAG TPA: hypothetical protein PLY87_03985 [Planctomycetaceae bacterium]|nr:hypothetical protein [Planctomycetaceae bacterium]